MIHNYNQNAFSINEKLNQKLKKKINNHKLVYILFFILCINLLKRQIIKTKIVLF
jgi:hypothetical protein